MKRPRLPWYDIHMHTPLCGHARGEPWEYVEQAAQRGLAGVCFTCHMPFDHPAFGGRRMRMDEDQLPLYLEKVADAREHARALGVEVLCGIEGEVFPDPSLQEALGEVLARHAFDYVLGSVHHHTPAMQRWLFEERACQSDAEVITAYFECVRDGAATGLFHSMSHPDVIRLYGTIDGLLDPAAHESVIREAIAAAVEADVCWEVNTSGRFKGPEIEHPDPLIRQWGREMGLKLTIGSDAHRPGAVGQAFDLLLPQLRAEGFDAVHVFRDGRREALPLALAERSPEVF
ncbi:MAG: histidinol-phosphatase [Opitutales bacterium]